MFNPTFPCRQNVWWVCRRIQWWCCRPLLWRWRGQIRREYPQSWRCIFSRTFPIRLSTLWLFCPTSPRRAFVLSCSQPMTKLSAHVLTMSPLPRPIADHTPEFCCQNCRQTTIHWYCRRLDSWNTKTLSNGRRPWNSWAFRSQPLRPRETNTFLGLLKPFQYSRQ